MASVSFPLLVTILAIVGTMLATVMAHWREKGPSLVLASICIILAVCVIAMQSMPAWARRRTRTDVDAVMAGLEAVDSGGSRLRTLWLTRHTRSQQNSAEDVFKTADKVAGLWGMLTGFDAPPSKRGWEMLEARAPTLQSEVLTNAGLQAIFFSPLLRAAATHDAVAGDVDALHRATAVLEEKRLYEILLGSSALFEERVATFEAAVLRRLSLETVGLVGHSKFFRQLRAPPSLFLHGRRECCIQCRLGIPICISNQSPDVLRVTPPQSLATTATRMATAC